MSGQVEDLGFKQTLFSVKMQVVFVVITLLQFSNKYSVVNDDHVRIAMYSRTDHTSNTCNDKLQ